MQKSKSKEEKLIATTLRKRECDLSATIKMRGQDRDGKHKYPFSLFFNFVLKKNFYIVR